MKNIKKSLFCAAALTLLASAVFAAEKKAPPKKAATTLENLQTAFNGESNAQARYEAFAARAGEEGYMGVAGLFRAVAVSEGVHVAKYAKIIESMGGVAKAEVKVPVLKSTRENLKAAITGENREWQKIYPEFLKKAQADKNDKAAMNFGGGIAVEKGHVQLFSQALAKLGDWKAQKKLLVCRNCGYVTTDLTTETCPVCSYPRSQFTEIE